MKELIVEDEMLLAMNAMMEVKSFGHQVVGIAPSSEAAFDALSSDQPEVVLVDIVIQGRTNGIELTRMISERYPQCSVIYMTAHCDTATLLSARQTWHLGILSKPFEPVQLKHMLEMAMQ